jgi:hypothetical protein
MSSQDESSPKAKATRKKNKMAQKKETKKIKVRDLKPKKDAKGGAVAHTSSRFAVSSVNRNQSVNQSHSQG